MSKAQHCEPINAMLENLSIIHKENDLSFQFEFIKSGGKPIDTYQIYLLAYPVSKEKQVFTFCGIESLTSNKDLYNHGSMYPCNIFDSTFVAILKKDKIKMLDGRVRWKKNSKGKDELKGRIFSYSTNIAMDSIAQKLQSFSFSNTTQFRFAVFIPSITDTIHTNDKSIEITHECPRSGDNTYLIFEPLPYNSTIEKLPSEISSLDYKFKHYFQDSSTYFIDFEYSKKLSKQIIELNNKLRK